MNIDEHDDYSVYQTSTISALLAGVYDGDLTVDELLSHGNFGLGTFNHLDGEMVVVDGVCYHLRSDGSAAIAKGTEQTPFAAVTHFHETTGFDIDSPVTMPQLTERIDAQSEGDNTSFAVRIEATFGMIRTRTVARQAEPYVPLVEAVQGQATTTFGDVQGTVAGFRTPQFEEAISVPGYHLHFVTADRARGGHILDFVANEGRVTLSPISQLHLALPTTSQFRNASIDTQHLAEQEHSTEG